MIRLLILVSLVCTEFAVQLSAASVTELIFQLIVTSDNGKQSYGSRIYEQYIQTNTELSSQLSQNAIPSINAIRDDLESRIQFWENLTSMSVYDFSDCTIAIRSTLSSDAIPDFSNIAAQEEKNVYESITTDTYQAGLHNIDIISGETFSMVNDYNLCMQSEEPSYCNISLANRISLKLEELPKFFEKEVQRANLNLLEQILNYEVRIQEYVQNMILATKPYLAVFDSCVSMVLTLG